MAEHACYSFSFPVVSLYDSYGKEALKYIMNHAEIKAIFLDTFQRLLNIIEIENDLPHLQLIVYFDDLNSNQLNKLNSLNSKLKLVSFKKFVVSCI